MITSAIRHLAPHDKQTWVVKSICTVHLYSSVSDEDGLSSLKTADVTDIKCELKCDIKQLLHN